MRNKLIIPDTPEVINGNKVLELEPGTIVKVVKHVDGANVGDILMKTSSYDAPFVNLENGSLWGCSLRTYEFLVLPYDTIKFETCSEK